MANYLQTKAIVLGYRDLAEHDRLYTLFTEERGKLEVRVRGARKILSKLQPPLSAVAVVRVLIYEGRSRPLLIGIETFERFPKLGHDLWRAQVAARFIRLVDLATKPEIRDQDLFCLLRDALGGAEIASVAQIGALRDAFIMQLLGHCGYRPELSICVHCRKPEVTHFSAPSGGVICSGCAAADRLAVKVSAAELADLRTCVNAPISVQAVLLRVSDFEFITRELLIHRLETPLWFPALEPAKKS
jgi:DNA repair protein RecO (recombination protein O)